MHMPHFVGPSLVEHLGYFHLLVIVNNAAINVGVHISFSALLPILLGIYSEMGSLHNMEFCF